MNDQEAIAALRSGLDTLGDSTVEELLNGDGVRALDKCRTALDHLASRLALSGAGEVERRFPIMHSDGGPESIPWAMIAPKEGQARNNHGQSLKRLAERGGLSPCEALAVLEGRGWRKMADAGSLLAERLAAFEADRSAVSQAAYMRGVADSDRAVAQAQARCADALDEYAAAEQRLREQHALDRREVAQAAELRGKRELLEEIREHVAATYPLSGDWVRRYEALFRMIEAKYAAKEPT